MELPTEAIALLGLPPARFSAARAEVARTLAQRGDRAAGVVKKLRRPVGVAWVLNRLSHDHPAEVRALLAAGDRLRAGQRRAVSGAGGEALREADAAVRQRARALRLVAERLLAAEGRPASGATLARIELLLRVAASGPAREALAAGTLEREPEVGEAGLSGLTLLAGGTAPPPAGAAPPRSGRREGARAAATRPLAREARDAARRRREHARAVAAAHTAAAKASARADREERAAEQAERRAREARERAASARTEANRAAARALEVERTGG